MRRSWIEGITPAAWIALALIILVLPLRWILAAILAAAFHELCHAAAVKLCGGKILDLRIEAGGIVMGAENMSLGKTLFCTLSGPVGALALLLFADRFPRLAVCAAFQSAYNLLPVSGLDGGQALVCICRLLFPGKISDRICAVMETGCLIFLGCAAIYGAVWLKLGLFPILAALAVAFRAIHGKIPCKPGD